MSCPNADTPHLPDGPACVSGFSTVAWTSREVQRHPQVILDLSGWITIEWQLEGRIKCSSGRRALNEQNEKCLAPDRHPVVSLLMLGSFFNKGGRLEASFVEERWPNRCIDCSNGSTAKCTVVVLVRKC